MDTNRLLSDYINNGIKHPVIEEMKENILVEGYWSETCLPKNGNYQKTEVIEKLKVISTFIENSWHALNNYRSVRRLANLKDLPVDGIHYMGYAHCRLCKKTENGTADVIITHRGKKLIFPSGYVHYLEEHGLVPTKEFEKIITEIDISHFENIKKELENLDGLALKCDVMGIMAGMGGLRYSN